MNGNKREFYCLERNLKFHEYSLIRGSCHTPSDGSQKYPESMNKKLSATNTRMLIGMQDLTPNNLFGCTATSSRKKKQEERTKTLR